ncbi:hypothetical protein [Bacteroides caecigallinarum]|uniref:hypothetical protein n=1 Tax=Bacteroides caecigallinarum TaxID=1411144 RepID=UPI001F219758|nr:hypothetical protein [Bacteroides caecigallinarum]
MELRKKTGTDRKGFLRGTAMPGKSTVVSCRVARGCHFRQYRGRGKKEGKAAGGILRMKAAGSP